jgi:uncharacterized protein YecE (DUF72 family)
MDFGKLTDISGVDFSLPVTNAFTNRVLAACEPTQPRVCIGPPIWSNKEWLGKIYPYSAKEKDFLYHYTRQFNTIELNVTHYNIPSEATVEKWLEASADGFKFCPKWPQVISHDRQLQGAEVLSAEFVRAVSGLGNHLGTTFLQLAPYFGVRQLGTLKAFLTNNIPDAFPIAVEFRHKSWFVDAVRWQETLALLHELGVGTVMSDVAGRRDVLHTSLTTPVFTLRFVGNELHPTDYTRVDAWVQRLKGWFESGLQTAYIFVHCGENNLAPELTHYWIEQLNTHCGLSLALPKIQPKVVQTTLF